MNQPSLAIELSEYPPGSRYLVGVSGGRDSVALLHLLVEAGFHRLIVCHLDHGLRKRASRADARFVEKLAASLNLEFETETVDVRTLAEGAGRSIETAAREARFAFFARVARRRRCRTVFLAHHADDQVETLLFNLFRGAGRAGLSGMNADCERVVAGAGEGRPVRLRLLRPMLGVWREQINAYIAGRHPYREDASNRSPEHTRNRIRHELLPLVEEIFGRDTRGVLQRTAEILRAEDEWLDALTSAPETDFLSVPELKAQPLACQRRRILAFLRAHAVPNAGFEQVETVRSLLHEARAKVNLPGDWHARRR